jgi:hypothetical protein
MLRILGPITRFVNNHGRLMTLAYLHCLLLIVSITRKMYPVGVLFGFGKVLSIITKSEEMQVGKALGRAT